MITFTEMAKLRCIYLFIFYALAKCANCHVMRQGRNIEETSRLSGVHSERNNLVDDYNYMKDGIIKNSVKLMMGNVQQHGKLTFVHHFGLHYLCRNIKGKAQFYTALSTRLCNTDSKFILQTIDGLCLDKGKYLDKWVGELFDLNGDGYVDHFERKLYKPDN